MAIFSKNKKLTLKELKRLTKKKGWISPSDREALLKEAKKYQKRKITYWEIRKRIIPNLRRSTKDTIKRWEISKIKKKLLGK